MENQPQHLRNLTLPFVAIISLALWLLSAKPIQWWQVPIILLGMELWDLGWHSSVHHPKLWLAHPIVRVGGVFIAITGAAISALL